MGEKLRSGFTTGTCAAAAGKAAAAILCSRQIMSWVQVKTADGTNVNMELVQVKQEENKVYCAVKKDAGDDPDITNGALIGAWAEWISEEEAKKAFKECYIFTFVPSAVLTCTQDIICREQRIAAAAFPAAAEMCIRDKMEIPPMIPSLGLKVFSASCRPLGTTIVIFIGLVMLHLFFTSST